MDDHLKSIGKKFSQNLDIASAQGTNKFVSNAAMMMVENLKPVDETEDCHKSVNYICPNS